MKTNVLMQRDFNGTLVTQRTDNSYFCATDLLRIYNENSVKQKRINDFWLNNSTDEFLESLQNQLSVNNKNSCYLKNDLFVSTRGKKGSTFMHPYLFVKFAMWLSSDYEVKVIGWIYDNLIKERNEAGDHYLEMCEAIKQRFLEWKGENAKIDPLVFIKEANFIKQLSFGYTDKGRNEANEKELKLLNALQLANIKLIQAKLSKEERHQQLVTFAKLYS